MTGNPEPPNDEKGAEREDSGRTSEIRTKDSGTISLSQQPHEFRAGAASSYERIPRDMAEIADRHQFSMWQWRIELHGLKPDAEPVGYDIVGNVILGRGVEGADVDIDLEPFDALAKGVSRQHAMIRPTRQRLFLIDLSSTNGIRHNENPSGPGLAITLRSGDVITLGDLTFEIRVIDQPVQGDESNENPLQSPETRPLSDQP